LCCTGGAPLCAPTTGHGRTSPATGTASPHRDRTSTTGTASPCRPATIGLNTSSSGLECPRVLLCPSADLDRASPPTDRGWPSGSFERGPGPAPGGPARTAGGASAHGAPPTGPHGEGVAHRATSPGVPAGTGGLETVKTARRGRRAASTAGKVATHGTRVALIAKTGAAVVVAGALVTGRLKLTHTGPFHRTTAKTHKTASIKKKSSPKKKTSVVPMKGNDVALSVPVSGSGGINYTQDSYLGGFEFKANTSISITKLGAYDSNLSALPSGSENFVTVPVALYDISSHTRMASANVSASDPSSGVYRYAVLSRPVPLNRNDTRMRSSGYRSRTTTSHHPHWSAQM